MAPLIEDEAASGVSRLPAAAEVFHLRFAADRPLGWLLNLVRRALRRLLAPILIRQSEYNRLNAELAAQFHRRLLALAEEVDGLGRRLKESAAALDERLDTLESFAGETERLAQELRAAGEKAGRQQDIVLQGLRVQVAEQVQGLGQRLAAALNERDARLRELEAALEKGRNGPSGPSM